VKVELKSLSRG